VSTFRIWQALNAKTRHLDLGPILTPAASLAPGEAQTCTMEQARVLPMRSYAKPMPCHAMLACLEQDHFSEAATGLAAILDLELIEGARPALESSADAPVAVTLRADVNNRNRSVGAMLSNELAKRHGGAGLPDGTITVAMAGNAGQSFGFTLARGIALEVEGDANDGCGKGLSGGRIVVRPAAAAAASGGRAAEDNVVVGNVALYVT
jgi:glutamate synthase domain-containing protein 3